MTPASTDLLLESSTISDCTALSSTNWRTAAGGAISLLAGSSATLVDSTISRTKAMSTAAPTEVHYLHVSKSVAHGGAVQVFLMQASRSDESSTI